MIFKQDFYDNLMINGKYFAGRTIDHLTPVIDGLRTKQCARRFQRVSKNSINLDGVYFSFNADKNHLEITVERGNIGDFYKRVGSVIKEDFWKDERLKHLRKKKNQYQRHLPKIHVSENGSGNVYFNADLETADEDKAFFAVLNCIIKPVLYSLSD